MRVLIADDHPMVRDALARTIHSIDAEVEIVEAGDYAAIEAQLGASMPDLALIDLHMPGMNGVDGLRRLRAAHPALPMAVASGDNDPVTIRAVLGVAGITGFLPKSDPPEQLRHALQAVMGGQSHVPIQALSDIARGAAPRADAHHLTPRQLAVLPLLEEGKPNKVIARELGINEGTVKIHINGILRALEARNRTEAAAVARRLGILK